MSNIINYIEEYKNKTFREEEFNEIDNVVFSSISYLNFLGIIPKQRKYINLEEALNKFFNKYTYKEVAKYGIAQKDSYEVIKHVVNSKRYRNVLVYNYFYESDLNKQFGALTFKVPGKFIYVSFEGTDNLLSGWKENFEMSYEFLVPAQKCAIEYLNKNIKLFDRNIIVGGHSKGGNLALVSAMYCKPFIRKKIKKIYSNDGPGLKKIQIESEEYIKVKDRYNHIVPNYSYVGVLLRNDKYDVIKSNRKDVLAHSVLTWQIEGNKFLRTDLSLISKNLEKSIILWLDAHDYDDRRKMITKIFKALEDGEMYTTNDLVNIRKSIKVIKNLNNIDEDTKNLVLNFLKFNLNYILKNSKGEF